MKLSGAKQNPNIDEHEIAGKLIDTAPLIMCALRQELRNRRPAEFTVPQFRVLAYLRRNEGATLSGVAEFMGLMRPTVSKMVESMERRGWLERATSAQDRRCMHLRLTAPGLAIIESARVSARENLAELFRDLPTEEKETVVRALDVLQRIFRPGQGMVDPSCD